MTIILSLSPLSLSSLSLSLCSLSLSLNCMSKFKDFI